MRDPLIYIATDDPALWYAQEYLNEQGCITTKVPSSAVSHLLLPVPLRSTVDPGRLLADLPENITVIGGNISGHPLLQRRKIVDLLQNEDYLAANAAITAECALGLGITHTPATLQGSNVLILGWGRIAQCLAHLASGTGARITVSARSSSATSMAAALGFGSVSLADLPSRLPTFHILFNTIPAMVLPSDLSCLCRPGCIMIDLASIPGIDCDGVISARGLPGKMAPVAAGRLIGKALVSHLISKEVLS